MDRARLPVRAGPRAGGGPGGAAPRSTVGRRADRGPGRGRGGRGRRLPRRPDRGAGGRPLRRRRPEAGAAHRRPSPRRGSPGRRQGAGAHPAVGAAAAGPAGDRGRPAGQRLPLRAERPHRGDRHGGDGPRRPARRSPPAQRHPAAGPRGPPRRCRSGPGHPLHDGRAVLRRLVAHRRPRRLRDPHRRAARRRAPGAGGRGVGHGHQPHPPGGRVPRRRALRPPRGHPGPDDAPDLPGLVPRVPAVREPRPATGDRRRGRRPLATGHDDRRARRGLRLRRARCARGHPRDRHGEGDRHRAGLGAGPERGQGRGRPGTTRDGSGGSSAPVADDPARGPGPAPSRAGPVDRRSPHWSSRASS